MSFLKIISKKYSTIELVKICICAKTSIFVSKKKCAKTALLFFQKNAQKRHKCKKKAKKVGGSIEITVGIGASFALECGKGGG